MLERLRQSLALRLALQHALVFALAAAGLFGVLYWLLADSLEAREQSAVERRAEIYAAAYNLGGVNLVKRQIDSERTPEVRPYFVRIVNQDNTFVWVGAPPDWVETQVEQIPFGLFTWNVPTQTVRVPQNALRDYAIASHQLNDGRLLQVGRLTDSRAVLLAPLRRAFLVVGAAALAVSFAAGTFLAWRSTRPLRALAATARRILATGDLAARVPDPRTRGELAALVTQLNTLLDRNADHVRVLRETLDNLAHDLRTPLTRLRGTAELALQGSGDPTEAKAALADCIDESDRLLHVLESLLDISAAEGGAMRLNREHVDLRALAERAANLYREVAEDRTIKVDCDLPAPVEANVDRVRLGQAVNNLLDNALKYTPEGGRVVLTVRAEPDAAVISISDNGPGIPTAEREAIFRRLYRGDSSRSQRGLGLGLSLVKAIVEAHGGKVSVAEAAGGGAQFDVRLPRS